jgi:hypothetical protein
MKKTNKRKPKVPKSKKSKEIEYLELLLAFSEKYVQGLSDNLDSLFKNQSNRIRLKIKELEQNQ